MRRHFSIQRLAIVVAWAALSPQCAQLVESWIGFFSKATVSDAAGVVPGFVGRWNRSSDRPGTVAENPVTRPAVTEWMIPAAVESPTGETAPIDLQAAARDVAALRFLGTLAVDTH